MLNIKTAAAALVMVIGASSLAVAAPSTRDHGRVMTQSTTAAPMYEGRSAYAPPAYDSQQPVQSSQWGLDGADNQSAR